MAVIGNSVAAGIRAPGSAQLESKCMRPQILSQCQVAGQGWAMERAADYVLGPRISSRRLLSPCAWLSPVWAVPGFHPGKRVSAA